MGGEELARRRAIGRREGEDGGRQAEFASWNGGSSVNAGDKAQAAVLDELETADGGGRVVGKDSGGHSHFPKRLMRSGAKGAESGVSYLLSLAILSPKFQTWSQRAIRITLTVQVKQKNQNSLFFL